MVSLYIMLVLGAYLFIGGLIINASGTQRLFSALLFKVIPCFGGLFLMLYSAKHLGWF
jgi:hypothetical protein